MQRRRRPRRRRSPGHGRRRSRPRRSASSRTSPGPTSSRRYTEHVLRVAAHLVELEQRTGTTVTLALEPEPHCFLETTDETVGYFERASLHRPAATRLAELAQTSRSHEAHMALRRHLGIVFDIGHQAVEFEDIQRRCRSSSTPASRSSSCRKPRRCTIPQVTDETVEALRRFAETIYLTQTVELPGRRARPATSTSRTPSRPGRRDRSPREWRAHFHVPVFLDDLGPFRTTRFAIERRSRMHKATPLSPPARDRDLHLGRAPGRPQDRRHRRVRLPRARVGPRRARPRGRGGVEPRACAR